MMVVMRASFVIFCSILRSRWLRCRLGHLGREVGVAALLAALSILCYVGRRRIRVCTLLRALTSSAASSKRSEGLRSSSPPRNDLSCRAPP